MSQRAMYTCEVSICGKVKSAPFTDQLIIDTVDVIKKVFAESDVCDTLDEQPATRLDFDDQVKSWKGALIYYPCLSSDIWEVAEFADKLAFELREGTREYFIAKNLTLEDIEFILYVFDTEDAMFRNLEYLDLGEEIL